MNELINVEKSHMSACTYQAVLSQANRGYSTLARQLEAVNIEVCKVQALRLRTNPWQVHKAKYLTSGTYSHTGFDYMVYMKVLVFAEPGHMPFCLNYC